MKKTIAVALAALTLTVAQVRPAQAVVGAVVGWPILTFAGVGVLGYYALFTPDRAIFDPDWGISPLGLTGLLLLDQSGSPTSQMRALTSEQAGALKINDAEMSSFNRELSEVNAVNERINFESASMVRHGSSEAEVKAFAQASWQNDKQALTPLTVSAAEKISQALK